MARRVVMWAAGGVIALSIVGWFASERYRATWQPPGGAPAIGLWRGRLHIHTGASPFDPGLHTFPSSSDTRWTPSIVRDRGRSRVVRVVEIPFWMLIGAASGSMLATVWFGRRRARMRADLGRCRHCGYDVSRTAGACPECGSNQ